MNVGIADRGRYSAEEFCKNLLGVLVLSGLYEIPIGDPSVEKAFGRIVRYLESKAQIENDSEFGLEIYNILKNLSPNSNSGAFDEFWATLRRLQPGTVTISNPHYPSLEIGLSPSLAKMNLRKIADDKWLGLIKYSARELKSAL